MTQRKTLLDYYNEERERLLPGGDLDFLDGRPVVPLKDYQRLGWVIALLVKKAGGRVVLTEQELTHEDTNLVVSEDWQDYSTVLTVK